MAMHLLDLHAHFPMHTRFPPATSFDLLIEFKKRLFDSANLALNYEDGKPRMALDHVRAGRFGGFASVLYDPEDEFLVLPEDPRPQAFAHVKAQLRNVEAEIAGTLAVARNPGRVEEHLRRGEKFLIHCVEGGFALGGDADHVDDLAALGIAYVIIAHLVYRGVATCENAIPHLPEEAFEVLNPQRKDVGLTGLGREIVAALLRRKVLIDITHCSDLAQAQIFEMAASFNRKPPLISSHNGVRGISNHKLNLSDAAIQRIAESRGIIGVIFFPYWLRPEGSSSDDLGLVFDVIEYIAQKTGSYDYVGIGTDLDGFIQPVQQCPNYSHIGEVEAAIRQRYQDRPEVAEKILWGNALRVLQEGWAGVP